MKVLYTAILTAMFALTSGAAFAAEEIPTFKKADVDGNKYVDENEFGAAKKAGVEKSLKELDTNGDGKLNMEEYSGVLDADCE